MKNYPNIVTEVFNSKFDLIMSNDKCKYKKRYGITINAVFIFLQNLAKKLKKKNYLLFHKEFFHFLEVDNNRNFNDESTVQYLFIRQYNTYFSVNNKSSTYQFSFKSIRY